MPRAARKPSDGQRKKALAAVHAGRRALRWCEERYRATIAQVARERRGAEAPVVTSASQLSLEELGAVIDVMRARGFTRAPDDTRPTYQQPAAAPRENAQLAMIRALWAELGSAGVVRTPTEEALRKFARRTARVDAIEWMTTAQASNVIEALKAMQTRAGAAAVGESGP
jgi:phage gp16-like protein